MERKFHRFHLLFMHKVHTKMNEVRIKKINGEGSTCMRGLMRKPRHSWTMGEKQILI